MEKDWQADLKSLESRVNKLETIIDILVGNPKYLSQDVIGFNGQLLRKKIFTDLVNLIKFDGIVETGTWIGNTAGYMSEATGLPVYTCELEHRFYSIARMRLMDFKNITFELSDSRKFLKELASSELSKQNIFFYLDAHWYKNLPLREEIEIITNYWKNFVIMIDDFKVPNDEGYEYDDYGESDSLTLKLIADLLQIHELVPFFPSFPSSEETGSKRGCVVLAKRGTSSEKISGLASLTEADGF